MKRPSLTEELARDRAEWAEEDADDAEWDRWLSMSEEEQDAEIEAGMAQLVEARSRLSLAQLYRHDRRSALKSCLLRRSHVKAFGGIDFAKQLLRETQVRLLKLREYRRTGVYPGSQ